jgi:hypothetical protein
MRTLSIFLASIAMPLGLVADSWLPPQTKIFSSDNGKYLLQVEPRAMESFPELPEDKAANDQKRKAAGLNEDCWATLFAKDDEPHRATSNEFRPAWRQKLVNEVAPMQAIISDDGKYVVTTDDYGRLGDGENVVVIYSEGELVRRYPLTAFVPKSAIENYEIPQSVSSIDWAGTHRIDSKNGLLELEVWQSGNPVNRDKSETIKYRTVTIRLSDGEIVGEAKGE